jgi:GDP-4-dehydro-6-deoxy-D-mannose reductase
MKRYIVTGVFGFVGYYFLHHLDSFGNRQIEVLGIDVAAPEDMHNYDFKHIRFRFISLNLLEYESLEIALVSFDPECVVHLASLSSVSQSWNEPVKSFVNNTNIFLNLLEILRRNKISCRILSVGSSEEYGDVKEGDIPLKETAELRPLSPYAIARVSQEMLSRCYCVSFNQDIVLTRSFNHIGPRQKDIFVISSFVKQLVEGVNKNQKEITLYTGDLSLIRDFLDVRDVVRAYYTLLEQGKAGELYNVCTGNGHSLEQIIDMLADLLHVSVRPVVDPDKIRPKDNKIIIGDPGKIFEHTGWRHEIPLQKSLNDLILYWKNIQ